MLKRKIKKLAKTNRFFYANSLSMINLTIFALAFAGIGLALLLSGRAAVTNPTGDINGDGIVNSFDLSLLLSSFDKTTTTCISNPSDTCDLNNDGLVNSFDLSILLSHWGETTAPGFSSPPWSFFGQPGNRATTPVPSDVVLDPGISPHGSVPLSTQVPIELAGQAAADSFVSTTSYTEKIFYVPLNTPLQPVRLCRTTPCLPSYGSDVNDLWRAAMGEGNGAVPDATTGKPITDQYIGGGLPMTADVAPSLGTDGEAIICLGGGYSGDPPWVLHNADGSVFTRPDGQELEGNCWEVWQLKPDPTYNPSLPISTSNTKWVISWGAHLTGFIRQASATAVNDTSGERLETFSGAYSRSTTQPTWNGPWVATPGNPNSTTYDPGWGVTAAETPLLTDAIQQHDCQDVLDGATDFGHEFGIELQYTRYPSGYRWWPGYSSDGNNANMAVEEGMRVWFKPNVVMPSGLTPAAQALFHTLQTYGAVVDDQVGGGPSVTYNADGSYKSGGALIIRTETPGVSTACQQLGITSALKGIPWSQISGPIKMGSDSNPNPNN